MQPPVIIVAARIQRSSWTYATADTFLAMQSINVIWK